MAQTLATGAGPRMATSSCLFPEPLPMPSLNPAADADLRAALVSALRAVAPAADPARLRDNRPLLLQLPLGAPEWEQFLHEVQQRLAFVIPARERDQLVTLDDFKACARRHRHSHTTPLRRSPDGGLPRRARG